MTAEVGEHWKTGWSWQLSLLHRSAGLWVLATGFGTFKCNQCGSYWQYSFPIVVSALIAQRAVIVHTDPICLPYQAFSTSMLLKGYAILRASATIFTHLYYTLTKSRAPKLNVWCSTLRQHYRSMLSMLRWPANVPPILLLKRVQYNANYRLRAADALKMYCRTSTSWWLNDHKLQSS